MNRSTRSLMETISHFGRFCWIVDQCQEDRLFANLRLPDIFMSIKEFVLHKDLVLPVPLAAR